MSYRNLPNEHHYLHRIGWLRATVLGANDGIVSTASLIIGVAAASAGRSEIIIAGIAGLLVLKPILSGPILKQKRRHLQIFR